MPQENNPCELQATSSLTQRQALQKWFTMGIGHMLLEAEQYHLSRILPDLFGFHIVQLGEIGTVDLLESSRILHRVVVQTELTDLTQQTGLLCSPEALPFMSNNIDVVVLPHLLEFESDPHQILREVERVLIGEGHVVLICFNPASLWGIWHLALKWTGESPWSGRFISAGRVKDWLRLLGFEIIHAKYFFFRAPLKVAGRSPWSMLEKLGTYRWPYCGGAYIIVGKKRLSTITPIKPRWHTAKEEYVPASELEPTIKAIHPKFPN